MSEENKNIDQLFSDAAHSESAPQYNSAYWGEMNNMLNARDKKKRVFIFWALGGSIAFAGLFLSLFTLNMDETSIKKRYTKQEMNLDIQNSNITSNQGAIHQKEINIAKANNDDNLNRSELNEMKNGPIHNELTNKGKRLNSTNAKQLPVEDLNNAKLRSSNELSTNNEFQNLNYTQLSNNENEGNQISETNIITSEIFLPLASRYKLVENKKGNLYQSDLKVKKSPRYKLYAKLGAGLMENYKTSRPYESGLFNLSLNLEFDFNNVLLRTGLGAQMTSNADLIVSQRKVINDIIVISLQKDLSYQSLIDMYIPLELGYKLNNTSFGVGAQLNYLVTTSMDLNNYENKELVNTEKQFGNKEGLNSFSTQGYVWIEQDFSSMIALGLKAGTNISGRINDGAYFNESATTNPIYGQLFMRINLKK